MKNSSNELNTLSFIIPPIEVQTALGRTFLDVYIDQIGRHQHLLKGIAENIYKAAKTLLEEPNNYYKAPDKQRIEALFTKIEAKGEPYIWLDYITLEYEAGAGIFTSLEEISNNELRDLCLMERLFKPSIEFSGNILGHLLV